MSYNTASYIESAMSATYLRKCLFVPGQQRDQIDQLARNVQLVFGQLAHLAQNVDLRSPAQQGDVVTWPSEKCRNYISESKSSLGPMKAGAVYLQ